MLKLESNKLLTFSISESKINFFWENLVGLAEYVHSKQIKNVLLMDRSARPAGIAVRHYLRSKYPESKISPPHIYFVNPRKFKIASTRTKRLSLLEEIKTTYPLLMKQREHPLLIYDCCIHTGNTIEPVKQAFENLNFNVKIGVGIADEDFDRFKLDLVVLKDGSCYPFGRSDVVSKDNSRLLSHVNLDRYEYCQASAFRRELSQIIDLKLSGQELNFDFHQTPVDITGLENQASEEIFIRNLESLLNMFAHIR